MLSETYCPAIIGGGFNPNIKGNEQVSELKTKGTERKKKKEGNDSTKALSGRKGSIDQIFAAYSVPTFSAF